MGELRNDSPADFPNSYLAVQLKLEIRLSPQTSRATWARASVHCEMCTVRKRRDGASSSSSSFSPSDRIRRYGRGSTGSTQFETTCTLSLDRAVSWATSLTLKLIGSHVQGRA